tara:strand:- start:7867 stop:8133 length:267 start_codon:yes stop_codon:yes gene_type:complete
MELCIIPPIMMDIPNNSRTLENGTKIPTTKGAKNRSNIKMVLTTIRSSPYLLILLFLKYSDTRNLSVEEKSAPTDWAKDSFLIKTELI